MDLTGKKALAFKLAYIDAFQRMEAIRSRLPAFSAWRWPSIWSRRLRRRLHRTAFKTLIQGDADK
jgi:hypothetical protein